MENHREFSGNFCIFYEKMSDRERSSPTLIETGLKNLIGGRDGNYPLISGINGKSI